MCDTNVINWKNVYYMICYCVDELRYFDDSLIEQEEIKGTHDLLAKLLIYSFEMLYKNGYLKKYRRETVITDKPYGNIDIAESVRTGVYDQGSLICNVDTLDLDNKINQIIKSAFTVLIESNNIIEDKISDELLTKLYYCRNKLKRVSNINITSQMLNRKMNIPEWYKPIYSVCKMILSDWLALDKTGNTRLLELNDRKRLWYIWEKFVRNFLTKELQEFKVYKPDYKISVKKSANPDILIYKENHDKVVVADCKWYDSGENTTANMYQAMSYGDIVSDNYPGTEVTSMLLYASNASTGMSDVRDEKHTINGSKVEEWQVNVNQDFEKIKQDIKNIIINSIY